MSRNIPDFRLWFPPYKLYGIKSTKFSPDFLSDPEWLGALLVNSWTISRAQPCNFLHVSRRYISNLSECLEGLHPVALLPRLQSAPPLAIVCSGKPDDSLGSLQ